MPTWLRATCLPLSLTSNHDSHSELAPTIQPCPRQPKARPETPESTGQPVEGAPRGLRGFDPDAPRDKGALPPLGTASGGRRTGDNLPTRFRAWPPDAEQRRCQRLGPARFLYSRQVTLVRVAGVQPNHIASAASLAVSRRKFPTPAPRGLPPQWPRHGPFRVSPERAGCGPVSCDRAGRRSQNGPGARPP